MTVFYVGAKKIQLSRKGRKKLCLVARCTLAWWVLVVAVVLPPSPPLTAKNTHTIMPPKKKKTPAWIASNGRKILFSDITLGKISENMKYELVFQMHHEFAVGDTPEEALRLSRIVLSVPGRLFVARSSTPPPSLLCFNRTDWRIHFLQQTIEASLSGRDPLLKKC